MNNKLKLIIGVAVAILLVVGAIIGFALPEMQRSELRKNPFEYLMAASLGHTEYELSTSTKFSVDSIDSLIPVYIPDEDMELIKKLFDNITFVFNPKVKFTPIVDGSFIQSTIGLNYGENQVVKVDVEVTPDEISFIAGGKKFSIPIALGDYIKIWTSNTAHNTTLSKVILNYKDDIKGLFSSITFDGTEEITLTNGKKVKADKISFSFDSDTQSKAVELIFKVLADPEVKEIVKSKILSTIDKIYENGHQELLGIYGTIDEVKASIEEAYQNLDASLETAKNEILAQAVPFEQSQSGVVYIDMSRKLVKQETVQKMGDFMSVNSLSEYISFSGIKKTEYAAEPIYNPVELVLPILEEVVASAGTENLITDIENSNSSLAALDVRGLLKMLVDDLKTQLGL